MRNAGAFRRSIAAFAPDGLGHGTAEFTATGFNLNATPAYVLLRSTTQVPAAATFDGVLCLGLPVARLGAGLAVGGLAVEPYTHKVRKAHWREYGRNETFQDEKPATPAKR